MIFVTLGSQKFPFDRLLKKIDELIEEKNIEEKVIAQIGVCEYIPKHYEYQRFMNQEAFMECIKSCDVVITHGGTGAIINAVKEQKKVIAVPRLAKFKEHVDDHQLQILDRFEKMNLICACYEIEELSNCLLQAKQTDYRKYVSNTENVIKSIEDYLEQIV